MSNDIDKLFQRPLASELAMGSARDVAAMLGLGDIQHLRSLLNPTLEMQSSIDRFLEDERRQTERYRDLFLPSTASTIDAMLSRGREFEEFIDAFGLSTSGLAAAKASDRMLAEVARMTDPASEMLDQLREGQMLAAPWLAQMETAADLARRFIDTWPGDDISRHGVDWEALDQHLAHAQDVIEQLPPRDATTQELQARDLSPIQRFTLVFALLGVLLQILALLQAREQIRFDRLQAAGAQTREDQAHVEEREFRERLIGTIEALIERAPDQSTIHVVGMRPVPVKSAITKGIFVGTGHPNQVVIVTERKGRWAKIRFWDDLEERTIEGWVLKHYLVSRPLNTTDGSP